MNEQIAQISARIRELREILDITQEKAAAGVGVSLEQYAAYEKAEDDIPIGVLYRVAVGHEHGARPEAIVGAITGEGGQAPDWRVEHPLQPFDARYFDGGDPALVPHDSILAEFIGGSVFEE